MITADPDVQVTWAPPTAPEPPDAPPAHPAPIPLVAALCRALDDSRIRWCHWKSNDRLDLSATGQNDLDLLVSRADGARFAEVLASLGFKRAVAPPSRQAPGIADYFGYEPSADRFVHVHAHYQLVLGHDATKNCRLPIEAAYLDTATRRGVFKVPDPAFELLVFIVRMVLKHFTQHALIWGGTRLREKERAELSFLMEQCGWERVQAARERLLPAISEDVLGACLRALDRDCPLAARLRAGRRLQRALSANARRGWLADTALSVARRVAAAIRSRILHRRDRYRLEGGGALVALVGGDGSGKTTAIDGLDQWLQGHFRVARVHLGKPSWSPPTIAVRAMLKCGQLLGLYPVESSMRRTIEQRSAVSPGYPWLLREVCRARDRYWTYVKARRRAAAGAIVLCDRFPLPELKCMDGRLAPRFLALLADAKGGGMASPRAGTRLSDMLVAAEDRYYARVATPDVFIVLRAEPRLAIARRPDDDPAEVGERSEEICRTDWSGRRACVVDASRSKEEVLAEVKRWVWAWL